MVEREMQELIWRYPSRFLYEPLKQFAWEASSEVGRADLVFEDRHGRLLIVEIKRGKLQRGAIDQLHDYFGMMKQKYPAKAVEMMVIASVIPPERRLACEHYDIDCRELSERFFREIAAEYGYAFASESQTHENKLLTDNPSEGVKLIDPITQARDGAGMAAGNTSELQAEVSHKLKQNAGEEVVLLPKLLSVDREGKNMAGASKPLPLPGLHLALTVLQLLVDDREHSSEGIVNHLKTNFDISPHELAERHKNGATIFRNNVALAIANLQGAPHKGPKAIEKVKNDVYRITEYGRIILKRNPSDLTIKDL